MYLIGSTVKVNDASMRGTDEEKAKVAKRASEMGVTGKIELTWSN
jgi:hypothetical protein